MPDGPMDEQLRSNPGRKLEPSGQPAPDAYASDEYAIDEYPPVEYPPGEYPTDERAEEPELVPSWAMRAWDWVSAPSVRPDRSPSLDNEPRGRLDKLDIWITVALVIAILAMRIYRLDQPRDMHFDEVYHARTAMEFLQDWRYNIPHDIYEWTHPHFAKYAIAAGIYLFDDHAVKSTSELGVPVQDVAIEPHLEPLVVPAGSAPTPAPSNGQPSIDSLRQDASNRLGDRLYVLTTNEVRAYDLSTRAEVARFAVPNASALYMSPTSSTLFVGTNTGEIYSIVTSPLDLIRLGVAKDTSPPAPVKIASDLGISIHRLWADPHVAVAMDGNGNAVAIDAQTHAVTGKGTFANATEMVGVGTLEDQLVVDPKKITDAQAEASTLATLTGSSAVDIQDALSTAQTNGYETVVNVPITGSADAIRMSIGAGNLAGMSVVSGQPQVIIADASGVMAVDARHLQPSVTTATQAPATSVTASDDLTKVYLAEGGHLEVMTATKAGNAIGSMSSDRNLRMPGTISRVYFDPGNNILHALGRTTDGKKWTDYAVETNGNSVFSDAVLPFQPVAWAADVTPSMPNSDRETLMFFDASGNVANVDIGQFAFSWRIFGVVFGALMAACLYLLTRVLFRRRTVGLVVAALALLDGMLFVQSRIAMNDTYVGGWLLAAYLVFALLWTGTWRGRVAFWLGMPLIGTLLGLALASKWVALYAIASIGMLILIRSALGRLITVLGLAVGTGVLGYLALFETPLPQGSDYSTSFYIFLGAALLSVMGGMYLVRRARTTPDRVLLAGATAVVAAVLVAAALYQSPPAPQNGGPNFTFFLIMLGVTAAAAAIVAYRPVQWAREEMWFAIVASAVAGLAVIALSKDSIALKLAGAGLIVLPGAAFYLLGRFGFGPLAPPPPPNDPLEFADPAAAPPPWWMRLGSGFGIPAIWMGACLLVLPIAIYVASYVPWAMPWQPQTQQSIADERGWSLPVLICFKADKDGNCPSTVDASGKTVYHGWPEGHTGQTLVQLTQNMYNYHNDLREPHPASSPWWAWPMDLKPVWFQSSGYAEDTLSRIYDGGNIPMWWLAIPAMAFVCWQAYRRRSLGLTLLVVAFFWQWLSWSRIDRASFQYHFYTALPFFLMALAYFVAELWHGPSQRTWLLARVAAAIAVVGAPLLWLMKLPLCGLGRVAPSGAYWKEACSSTVGDMVVTNQVALIVAILVAALVALAVILYRIERRSGDSEPEGFGWILQLSVPVVVAGALLLFVGSIAPEGVLIHVGVPAEPVAFAVLLLLGAVAWVALTARDPRRFTLGILVTALIGFVALYPNLSALPLPGTIASAYNGFIPTWLYGFQFGVNQEQSAAVSLFSESSLFLTVGVLAVAGVVAYAAWIRRVIVGYQRREALFGRRTG